MLLTNEHSLTYNQNDRFAFFLRHKLKLLSKCCVLKSVSICTLIAMKAEKYLSSYPGKAEGYIKTTCTSLDHDKSIC